MRASYEDIVRTFKHRPGSFMSPPSSGLSPKEHQLVSLMAKYGDQQAALKNEYTGEQHQSTHLRG